MTNIVINFEIHILAGCYVVFKKNNAFTFEVWFDLKKLDWGINYHRESSFAFSHSESVYIVINSSPILY